MSARLEAGFTLAEVSVALLLGLLISGAAFSLVATLHRAELKFQADAHRAASLRRAAQRLGRTIRSAGAGVGTPLSDAGPASLIVLRDLDGDGLTLGSQERVRCWLDGGTLREGSQPVAEGVTRLDFRYRVAAGVDGLNDGVDNDGDGAVDERGEWRDTDALSGPELHHVRLVEVTIGGHGPLTEAAHREVRTQVALVNAEE